MQSEKSCLKIGVRLEVWHSKEEAWTHSFYFIPLGKNSLLDCNGGFMKMLVQLQLRDVSTLELQRDLFTSPMESIPASLWPQHVDSQTS